MQNHLRRAHADLHARDKPGRPSPYPQARQRHARGQKDSSTQPSAPQTQQASNFSILKISML